jgi:predicted transcriptional regulator
MSRESPSRRAEKRAQYLTATTELEYRKAHALAFCEQGCNERSIAKEIGSTKGTVSNYLDEIVERYGPETVVSVGVDEKKDLTPVEDQPTKGPLKTVESGRKVVLKGESRGPHTVERYFRTWMQDGRICRDAKVALSLHHAVDEDVRDRLGNLDWDAHHATYDPEYEFVSAVERGCWTFDTDRTTLASVRDIVHVPPLDTMPLVATTLPRREDLDPFACTNPDCSTNEAHSDKDLLAYPQLSGPAIEITKTSDAVSRVCLDCRTLFTPVPVGVPDQDNDGEDNDDEHDDGVLVEAMQ